MSETESVIRQLVLAALLALLGSYLVLKHRQRERQRRRPYDPAEWTGKGIDVTTLKPTVEEVRRSYPRPQATGTCFHRSLMALARQAVIHLPYFQEREEQENPDTHAR